MRLQFVLLSSFFIPACDQVLNLSLVLLSLGGPLWSLVLSSLFELVTFLLGLVD